MFPDVRDCWSTWFQHANTDVPDAANLLPDMFENIFVLRFSVVSKTPLFSIISRLRPQPNPYHHLDLALKFPVWASIPENLGSRPQSCQILRPMEGIWSGTDGIWKHLEASGGICMVSAHKSSATLERNAKVPLKC